MRGVVVNAGNANCATGTAGHAAAQRTFCGRSGYKGLGCHPEELFVCSTGVIAVPLLVEKYYCSCLVIARYRRLFGRCLFFAELSLAICTH